MAKDAAEIECTCWQHKEDRPKGAFSAPCASPNCVYAYVNSGQQSFEQFKIQLGNVNKFVTVKVWFKYRTACIVLDLEEFLSLPGT